MDARADRRLRLLATPLQRAPGVISVREAHALGASSRVLQRLVNDGVLLSLAKGMYADRATYDRMGPWPQYRLRSAAFTLRSPGAVASEWSAACFSGLPTWGDPPSLPTVIRSGRPAGGTTRTPNGRVRRLDLTDPALVDQVHDVFTTSAALTAVDLARHLDFADGLALVDAAARAGSGDFGGALSAVWACYGAERARRCCELADARSESIVESFGRAALIESGLPPPLSNVWICDGRMPHRVDQLIPDCAIVLEADGAVKYDGPGAAGVIRAEKEREWRLCELGFAVIRYDMSLARGRPRELARRVRLLLDERRGMAASVGWSWTRPIAA